MADPQTLALLIPAYNAAQFLPRLLKSASEQTVPFDEILVYDDCSTDGTADVAERLGARVVRGDVNRGCSAGKNVLLQHTQCTWVHFHDADDVLLPDFVKVARRWMPTNRYDVVIFACEERDADTKTVISVAVPDSNALIADPVYETINYKINSISGIYRLDKLMLVGGYDADPLVLYNEDQAMHCKLARAGLRFAADPTVTVVNLRRQNSMWTANLEKCQRAQFEVMKKAYLGCTSERQVHAVARRLWEIAGVAASLLDWKTAVAAADLAMRLSGPSTTQTTGLFRALCRISPRFALRAREYAIRVIRPQTRRNAPGIADYLRTHYKQS